MAHYFDVISCGIKEMHAQFSLLFGFHNAMVLLNKLSRKIKLNTVEDSPEKTLRKNLTATPFSYMNNTSVDLNELCLHITFLFLEELVFVSDVFLLTLLSHEKKLAESYAQFHSAYQPTEKMCGGSVISLSVSRLGDQL